MDFGMGHHVKDPGLEDYLRGKRVVFAGPAPHLEGQGMGGFIDSFDVVCRVNQHTAIPPNRVRDYGSRTDLLCTIACLEVYPVLKGEFRMQTDFVRNLKYALCLEGWPGLIQENHKKTYDLLKSHDICVHKVRHEYRRHLIEDVGIQPNTGLVGITVLLQYPIRELYVTGMSFFNMGRGGKVYHDEYFDNQVRDGLLRPRLKKLQDKPMTDQALQIPYFQEMLKFYGSLLKVDSYVAENFEVSESQKVTVDLSQIQSPAPAQCKPRPPQYTPPLSIFTVPEDFSGVDLVVQRNSIQSWLKLEPRPEVIVMGDNLGVAEFAAEFGLTHIGNLQLDEDGGPLIADVFGKALAHASNDVLMYANPDLVFLDDLTGAVRQTYRRFEEFLMTGQRWRANITKDIDFCDPDWARYFRLFAYATGFQTESKTDYCVFTRGLWDEMGALRPVPEGWGSRLAAQSMEEGKAFIDVTDMVMAIGHNHEATRCGGPDRRSRFVRAFSSDGSCFGLPRHAVWKLTPVGIVLRPAAEHIISLDFGTAMKVINLAWSHYKSSFEDDLRFVLENLMGDEDRFKDLIAEVEKLQESEPDNEMALRILREWAPLDMDACVDYFKKGVGYLEGQEPRRGLACFKRATTGPRCFPDLFYATAMAYARIEDFVAAAKECRRGINSYPGIDQPATRQLLEAIEPRLNQAPA